MSPGPTAIWTVFLALAVTLLPMHMALAQEAVLIHSDEPLWVPDDSKVWPRHFYDADSFGCIHPIPLGDWRYTPTEDKAEPSRYRFGNYGVFHCHMNISHGYEDSEFDQSRPGFLVNIGRAGEVELWTLQIGARPGSDYVLLAKAPGQNKSFDILQRVCPGGHTRGGPSLDVLSTQYCAINSRRELVSLAKRMLKLPPLATLTYEAPAPGRDEP